MKEKVEKPILEGDHYTGEISVNGITAPIGFKLSAGADCRLVFEVDSVEMQTYLLVQRDSGRPGQKVRQFALNARSADGKIVTSDNIYLGRSKSNGDGFFIELRAQSVIVTHPVTTPAVTPLLRLWFRSFKSFRNPTLETSLGKLTVYGEATDVAIDDMSGYVALRATSSNPGNDWCLRADEFLRHMHRGLALAHGGRLQTPRLDYAAADVYRLTFYSGSGFQPEFPIQYHLNHGPFIQALASRYELRGPLPDILWTALGWMQIETTFDEIRFLTAMTALETIIENELPELRGTTLPKEDFKIYKKAMSKIISESVGLSDTIREIFIAKISGLNKKTFSEKISALFDHYGISTCDFGGNTIANLVNLRNKIVHEGVSPDSVDLWPQIILVRELITRILLQEMGFKGQYCCYIGGLHSRSFPESIVVAGG